MKTLILLFISLTCFAEPVRVGVTTGWFVMDVNFEHDHIVAEGYPEEAEIYEHPNGDLTVLHTFLEEGEYDIMIYTYLLDELVNTRTLHLSVYDCSFSEYQNGIDVNNDCKIDLIDFSAFAQEWLADGKGELAELSSPDEFRIDIDALNDVKCDEYTFEDLIKFAEEWIMEGI